MTAAPLTILLPRQGVRVYRLSSAPPAGRTAGMTGSQADLGPGRISEIVPNRTDRRGFLLFVKEAIYRQSLVTGIENHD